MPDTIASPHVVAEESQIARTFSWRRRATGTTISPATRITAPGEFLLPHETLTRAQVSFRIAWQRTEGAAGSQVLFLDMVFALGLFITTGGGDTPVPSVGPVSTPSFDWIWSALISPRRDLVLLSPANTTHVEQYQYRIDDQVADVAGQRVNPTNSDILKLFLVGEPADGGSISPTDLGGRAWFNQLVLSAP